MCAMSSEKCWREVNNSYIQQQSESQSWCWNKKPDTREHIHYDSIYVRLKKKTDKLVLEICTVVTFGEKGGHSDWTNHSRSLWAPEPHSWCGLGHTGSHSPPSSPPSSLSSLHPSFPLSSFPPHHLPIPISISIYPWFFTHLCLISTCLLKR